MTTMRLYLHTALTTLLLFVLTGVIQHTEAQEAQSDYEVVQSFNNTYDELQSTLDTVSTVETAENLIDRIESFRSEYSEHQQLLNKALYPQKFEPKLQRLSNQAEATLERLRTIAQQKDKLRELTGNVNNYEGRLSKLQKRSDSLQKIINEANQRNRNLSGAVKKYRSNISERDQLVLSILDSLVANYKQLDTQTLQELHTAYNESRKNIDSNALKLIQTIARTNIEFLNSSKTLAARDYLRMYSVQQKFREMWRKIGDNIIDIYKPEDGSEAIRSELKNSLDEWETKIADQTWKSINQAFDDADIDIAEFGDSQGFYQSLTAYVDNQIEEGDRQAYQEFSNFWNNTVKTNWAEYVTGTDILTYDQMSNIDQKLNEWDNKTASTSYLWKILMAVAVLIIIVMGIMLARAKSAE